MIINKKVKFQSNIYIAFGEACSRFLVRSSGALFSFQSKMFIEGNHVAIAIYKCISLFSRFPFSTPFSSTIASSTELRNLEWDRPPPRSMPTISHLRFSSSAIPASAKVAFYTPSFPPLSTISLPPLVPPISLIPYKIKGFSFIVCVALCFFQQVSFGVQLIVIH